MGAAIHDLAKGRETVKICHVCGTHEWTITHHGLRNLLPPNVELIAGPGCPVCIVPASEIDEAVRLAREGIVITLFGDLLRVPGSQESLLEVKAEGGDVRVVYGIRDAVRLASKEPDKEFVFFAVGFETTAPSSAVEVLKGPPRNFSLFTSHRRIPPAMRALAEMPQIGVAGFIAPGHVSTVIGVRPYEVFPRTYRIPTVIAGFEPLDVLFSVYMILRQLDEESLRVENEYSRIVQNEGNLRAQEVMRDAFETVDARWRGLGTIPASALRLREQHSAFDTRKKHGVKTSEGVDTQPGCRCNLIIVGMAKPADCPLFMKSCTPRKPVGACMVGSEGTCRIWAENQQSFPNIS